TALIAVGLENSAEEVACGALAELELMPLGRVPGTELAPEHDTVPRVEEHLRGATRGGSVVRVLSAPKREPNVADAFSSGRQAPWLAACFVVQPHPEIPGAVGERRESALPPLRLVGESESRFTHEL